MRKQLPWFKVYPEDWLADGVTLFLTPAQRGVFISLQAVASTSPNRGTIQASPGTPYEPTTLARRCRCKINLLTATLNRLEQKGKITRDSEGIHIIGWQDDQEGVQLDLEGKPHPPQIKKRGRPVSDDPDKFKKGKYSHMIATTHEDVERLKKIREAEKAKRANPERKEGK